jgi:hypothetical protein
MRFLLVDNASGNVLEEFETSVAAEQRRIQIVGMNPDFSTYIEVVDSERALQAYRADSEQLASEPQAARTP